MTSSALKYPSIKNRSDFNFLRQIVRSLSVCESVILLMMGLYIMLEKEIKKRCILDKEVRPVTELFMALLCFRGSGNDSYWFNQTKDLVK